MGECVLMNKLNQKLLTEALTSFKKGASYVKIDNPHILLDYLKIYNVKEITEQWYDSSPPECQTCDVKQMEKEYGPYPCSACPYLEVWSQTEDCLTKLTWIDAWGPNLWDDINQDETNEMYDNIIVDLLEEVEDIGERVYLIKFPDDVKSDILIFVYARDIKTYDYGFVLEKK